MSKSEVKKWKENLDFFSKEAVKFKDLETLTSQISEIYGFSKEILFHCIEQRKSKRAAILRKYLCRYFNQCYIIKQNLTTEEETINVDLNAYNDAMVMLLSKYIDIILLSTDMKAKEQRSTIITALFYFLGSKEETVTNALLDSTLSNENYASVFSPIYKRVIEEPIPNITCSHYVKLSLLAKKRRSWVENTEQKSKTKKLFSHHEFPNGMEYFLRNKLGAAFPLKLPVEQKSLKKFLRKLDDKSANILQKKLCRQFSKKIKPKKQTVEEEREIALRVSKEKVKLFYADIRRIVFKTSVEEKEKQKGEKKDEEGGEVIDVVYNELNVLIQNTKLKVKEPEKHDNQLCKISMEEFINRPLDDFDKNNENFTLLEYEEEEENDYDVGNQSSCSSINSMDTIMSSLQSFPEVDTETEYDDDVTEAIEKNIRVDNSQEETDFESSEYDENEELAAAFISKDDDEKETEVVTLKEDEEQNDEVETQKEEPGEEMTGVKISVDDSFRVNVTNMETKSRNREKQKPLETIGIDEVSSSTDFAKVENILVTPDLNDISRKTVELADNEASSSSQDRSSSERSVRLDQTKESPDKQHEVTTPSEIQERDTTSPSKNLTVNTSQSIEDFSSIESSENVSINPDSSNESIKQCKLRKSIENLQNSEKSRESLERKSQSFKKMNEKCMDSRCTRSSTRRNVTNSTEGETAKYARQLQPVVKIEKLLDEDYSMVESNESPPNGTEKTSCDVNMATKRITRDAYVKVTDIVKTLKVSVTPKTPKRSQKSSSQQLDKEPNTAKKRKKTHGYILRNAT